MKNYFGVTELLNSESAPAIWNSCNEKLQKPEFSARNLIVKSGVKALCTTDDPADDLACHRALAADESFPVKVLPAYRPETALHPEQPNFQAWIVKRRPLFLNWKTHWKSVRFTFGKMAA